MANKGLLEYVAEQFKIARQEGALTKWADGKSDADDVLAKMLEVVKGAGLTPEAIDVAWISESLSADFEGDIRAHANLVAQAQLQAIIKAIEEVNKDG